MSNPLTDAELANPEAWMERRSPEGVDMGEPAMAATLAHARDVGLLERGTSPDDDVAIRLSDEGVRMAVTLVTFLEAGTVMQYVQGLIATGEVGLSVVEVEPGAPQPPSSN